MTALETATRRTRMLDRYRPGRAFQGHSSGKLSSNEIPLGPSPAAIRAISDGAASMHLYEVSTRLRDAIAADAGVPPETVVVTNGSDELCYLLGALLIDPGSPVVLSSPCYRIDELSTRLNEGAPRTVPLLDGNYDLPAMAEASEGAAVLWLPTPHNPTGRAVSSRDLGEFLDLVSPECLVVVDEAYRPFAGEEFLCDTAELLETHSNLLFQRTFSKSHGLAGLRIGYGLGPQWLIELLETARPPFNVNATAINAAMASLGEPSWAEYSSVLVQRQRDQFENFLERLGIRYWPSQANFVTLAVDDIDGLMAEFEKAGIAVRNGSDLGLPGYIRISIGLPPQMAKVQAILTHFTTGDKTRGATE